VNKKDISLMQKSQNLVPALCVGMPGAALRAAYETQERLDLHSTLSVERAIEKCEGTNA